MSKLERVELIVEEFSLPFCDKHYFVNLWNEAK